MVVWICKSVVAFHFKCSCIATCRLIEQVLGEWLRNLLFRVAGVFELRRPISQSVPNTFHHLTHDFPQGAHQVEVIVWVLSQALGYLLGSLCLFSLSIFFHSKLVIYDFTGIFTSTLDIPWGRKTCIRWVVGRISPQSGCALDLLVCLSDFL